MCAIILATTPVTNSKYYNYYVAQGRIKKVFPSKISDNVKNIEFYYLPGFLQGSTNYSLYYIDNNMTKEKLDEEYKDKALWIGYKKDYIEEKGLLEGAFVHTPAYDRNEDDYILYVIEGQCDDSGYCNHGNFLLVAFNPKTNELIFRFSQW